MLEIWKKVKAFTDYEVSTLGNVASSKYSVQRILKVRKNSRGYLYVNLCKDGKYKSICVHRLVANAFLKDVNETVNHKNGIKTDNRLEILEWCSKLNNIKHAKENNLYSVGIKNGNHKLSEKDVIEIRELIKTLSFPKIGKMYKVSKTAISKIAHNQTWKKFKGS